MYILFLFFYLFLADSLVYSHIDNYGYYYNAFHLKYPNDKNSLPIYIELMKDPLKSDDMAEEIYSTVKSYCKDTTNNKYIRIFHFFSLFYQNGIRGSYTNLINDTVTFEESVKRISRSYIYNENEFGSISMDTINIEDKNISIALGRFIDNVIDAYTWYKNGYMDVSDDKKDYVYNYFTSMPVYSNSILFEYDKESLIYASMKIIKSAADLICNLNGKLDTTITVHTKMGDIIIGSGKNDEYHFDKSPFILIETGGNDRYYGRYAIGNNGIGLLIDMSGNDEYYADSSIGGACGICGIGMIFDKEGNDVYKMGNNSLGCGIKGVGALFDFNGNDKYSGYERCEGYGYDGLGMIFDMKGKDKYYAYGDAQGCGTFTGVGSVIEINGNDEYILEKYSKVFNRGDYHSKYEINYNCGQGYGGGERRDGGDGHSLSGGIGVLLDIKGNDKYEGGNWVQGVGYWQGIGIIADGEGNDVYKAVYFSQASSAHFSCGIMYDRQGDDKYILENTGGAGQAFGWDFGVSYLKDCKGDDIYKAKIISQSVSMHRSFTVFEDVNGNDKYVIEKKTHRWGDAVFNKSYKEKSLFSYWDDYANFSLFLDCKGKDEYIYIGEKKDKNDTMFVDDTTNCDNIGIFKDCEIKN